MKGEIKDDRRKKAQTLLRKNIKVKGENQKVQKVLRAKNA